MDNSNITKCKLFFSLDNIPNKTIEIINIGIIKQEIFLIKVLFIISTPNNKLRIEID